MPTVAHVSERLGLQAWSRQRRLLSWRTKPGSGSLDPATQAAARTLAQRIINCVDIDTSPVYLQLKGTARRMHLVEVTARLHGCHLWRLGQLKYGADLLDLTLRALEGASAEALSSQPITRDRHPGHDLEVTFGRQLPGTPFVRPDAISEVPLCEDWYARPGEQVVGGNPLLSKTGYRISRAVRTL